MRPSSSWARDEVVRADRIAKIEYFMINIDNDYLLCFVKSLLVVTIGAIQIKIN